MHLARFGCAVALALLPVTQARADEPAPDERRVRARELADQGDAAFSIGRCDRAVPLWKQAEAQFHAPTILLRVARCQALLGKVVDATATLESITAEKLAPDAPQPFLDAIETAKHDLPSLRARIATIGVTVRSGATVIPVIEIDDQRVSAMKVEHAVDPGTHRVRVRAGDATWEQTVQIDDAETKRLEISLTVEAPAHRVSTQRIVGYALGGLGLVAMAVGAGFGYAAVQTSNSLSDVCGNDNKHCPPTRQGDVDKVKTDALVSDVTIGAGAALFIGGGIVLLTEPAKREQSRVRLVPFGMGARLCVSF